MSLDSLERAADRLIDQSNQMVARIAVLEAALRWLVHLGCDVGRAGGRPEPGEFETAIDEAKALLEGDPE